MAIATLETGERIEYIETSTPPTGTMKSVYFTRDGKQAVAFFSDPNASSDRNRIRRLEAVIGRFNPTLGVSGEYWKQLFCWPSAIIKQPSLGVVLPHYSTLPGNYFFANGIYRGKEKEGSWFTSAKHRAKLMLTAPQELGNWKSFLSICILLSRAVRRLHYAGLAHSDLSNKNVLIDPTSGRCIVIDIDSLVVPGLFPPDVIGTPGYIAPEVLATQTLPLNDPTRKLPSVRTDLHALAVLIYEYLFFRHPLVGPKVYPNVDGREQQVLEMGENGVFVEHPTDHSNRPDNLGVRIEDLGTKTRQLFERAFINGLKQPSARPSAGEWEKSLMTLWDLLHPCNNSECWAGWFILDPLGNRKCFHCQHSIRERIPVMVTMSKARNAWVEDGRVVIFDGKDLNNWHVYENRFPGENADRTRVGFFTLQNGRWLLVNEKLTDLRAPSGNLVPPSGTHAIELNPNSTFALADAPHGRLAKIVYV